MKKALIAVFFLCFAFSVFGADDKAIIATTEDGRKVVLLANGTWQWLDSKASAPQPSTDKVKPGEVKPEVVPTDSGVKPETKDSPKFDCDPNSDEMRYAKHKLNFFAEKLFIEYSEAVVSEAVNQNEDIKKAFQGIIKCDPNSNDAAFAKGLLMTPKESEERLCKDNPKWKKQDCVRIIKGQAWIGMSYDMMVSERGIPDHENKSNYGHGNQWQWCYDNKRTPHCFYDKNDDGIIDAFN